MRAVEVHLRFFHGIAGFRLQQINQPFAAILGVEDSRDLNRFSAQQQQYALQTTRLRKDQFDYQRVGRRRPHQTHPAAVE